MTYNRQNLKIRWCTNDELSWVNQQYKSIGFALSSLDKDRIALAIDNENRAGLVRLCHLEDDTLELGGMYVLPEHREKGIARLLLRFLLQETTCNQHIYCLAFAHLAKFYSSEGFVEVEPTSQANLPTAVINKHSWCCKSYQHDVLLLRLDHKKTE